MRWLLVVIVVVTSVILCNVIAWRLDGPIAPADPTPGSIEGRVFYAGPAVAAEYADGTADPNCPPRIDVTPVVVDVDGSLRNTVVYVDVAAADVAPTYVPPPSTHVVRVIGCRYETRLVVLQRGQSVELDYSAENTLHNPHPLHQRDRHHGSWSYAPKWPHYRLHFDDVIVGERIRCDVHKWMTMYAAVFAHPFYFATGNGGAYRIEAIPPGEYTLATWHESLGELNRTVRVEPGLTTLVNFTYHVGR